MDEQLSWREDQRRRWAFELYKRSLSIAMKERTGIYYPDMAKEAVKAADALSQALEQSGSAAAR